MQGASRKLRASQTHRAYTFRMLPNMASHYQGLSVTIRHDFFFELQHLFTLSWPHENENDGGEMRDKNEEISSEEKRSVDNKENTR